ncbi:MAG TPA: hypothetical protein VJW23_02075 [Propionibacteriaceae bacterium]|nr:hypothetical protein [Propionibacteriaceae bacterium]
MSEDTVEIVRRAYAAFNRHDWDAALEAADPNVVVATGRQADS